MISPVRSAHSDSDSGSKSKRAFACRPVNSDEDKETSEVGRVGSIIGDIGGMPRCIGWEDA